MTRLFFAGLLALGLAGCQTDPFCASHTATDFTPNQAAWQQMSPTQRQEAARTLNEAAQRCRWEP
jgi:hypothetical protein